MIERSTVCHDDREYLFSCQIWCDAYKKNIFLVIPGGDKIVVPPSFFLSPRVRGEGEEMGRGYYNSLAVRVNRNSFCYKKLYKI